jgi:3-deoxy-7-phosphoheptulonate synthase
MPFFVQKKLPTKAEVTQKYPLTDALQDQVFRDREEIKAIFEGTDGRKILVVGPCSAWPTSAVLEYAKKLKPVADKHQDKIKIVMRTYIQKPRTTVGWQGPIVQPDPFEEPDMVEGIFQCRDMMREVIKIGLPISDEILFPRKQSYFRDMFSWAAIGARSTENQEHRILSSMLHFPIGMKNPTSGCLKTGVNSVIAAQSPNFLAMDGMQVRTSGNPHAHIVLRGGNGQPNISLEHLHEMAKHLNANDIQNPSIIVDVSHDNTRDAAGKKDHNLQGKNIFETLEIAQKHPELKNMIKGWMAESFLAAGKQNHTKHKNADDLVYGQSITDGCLGFDETVDLIEQLHGRL